MISNPTAQAGTALSPEWDRGFDEAFTELISADPDLVRTEFDALIGANYSDPPTPPEPPAPSHAGSDPPEGEPDGSATSTGTGERESGATGVDPRPPP